MVGRSIVDQMLKKAEEAEAKGNKEQAEFWLKRASETEEHLQKLGENDNAKI
jgi:hypothetical protein